MQPTDRLMSAMGLGPDADEPNDTEFDVTDTDLWQSK